MSEPQKVVSCRIPHCGGIALVPSTLCYQHLVRGKAALGLFYGDSRNATTFFHGSQWTNLYAVKAEEYVKFGTAENPHSRLKGLQTGCPLKIELFGFLPVFQQIEFLVHKFLIEDSVHGEWFHFRGRCVEVAEAVRERNHRKLGEILGLSVELISPNASSEKSGGCNEQTA